MAALITESIPTQRFELIRDQIALILGEELANQADLQSNDLFDATIFVERISPPDQTEMPCINIFFVRASYTDQNPILSKSDPATFYIDVYANANDTQETRGDQLAALKLHKLIGAIRYILEHPHYIRLGFTEKFIHHTQVTSIDIAEPKGEPDAVNTVFGRLTFDVTFNEVMAELTGTSGQVFNTTVKIDTSEKGYLIVVPQISN